MKYNTYSLGQLVSIKYGKNQKNVQSEKGVFPIYGTGGLMGYATNFLYDKPSVLIGRKGTIDKVRYIDHPFWTVDTLFYTIVNDDIVIPKYLYYLMSLIDFSSYNEGTTIPSLRTETLNRLEFNIPDVEYQKKVLEILEPIDLKIKNNKEINDNLHQQAKAIFEHMFQENASTSPATIADIALNVTDGVHNTVKDDPEGQYLLLSCKNIKGGSLSIGSSERKINSETFEKLRRRTKLEKGDILISSVGTVGELLLLNTEPLNYEFQRSVAIVKPNPEFVSSAYVYESLVAQKAELINAAHGAVQQCLFISDIAGFPIGIPNTDTLRSFDETVKPMFDTISANEAENSRLEALRDTLLPKLMSGEIDVSDIDL